MMRSVLSAAFQFVIFLVTFLLGSIFLHPFHLQTTLASDAAHRRVFVWDGFVLMVLLYLLVLALEAALRKVRTEALGSTMAVVLAGALGLAMKFGFVSVDR